MNTIEQAREAATQMRSIFISEDVSSVQARKWAGTIDALIAELNDERMRCAQADNAVEQMTAEIASIKAQEPIGYAVGINSFDGCIIRSTPLGIDYVPVYSAAGAQPVPTMESIKNAAKAAGLEFDCFSYEGTNQLVDFVAMLAAAPVQAGAEPAQDGFDLLPKSVIEMTLNCLNTPERADLRLVLRDLHKALRAAPAQAQERKPLTDEVVRLANVALHEMPRPSTDWHEAAKRVCQAVSAHGIKEQP